MRSTSKQCISDCAEIRTTADASLSTCVRSISRFSLTPHRKAGIQGIPRAELLFDDRSLGISIPGVVLRFQFESTSYYLLVTSCGQAFEEAFAIVLLDRKLRQVSTRVVATEAGGWLRSVRVEKDDSLLFQGARLAWDSVNLEDVFWRVSVRKFAVPLLYPRIRMTRFKV